MILTYQKEFPRKNGDIFQILKFFFQIAKFYDSLLVGSQEYKRTIFRKINFHICYVAKFGYICFSQS
jgi:hypothetical protein